MTIVRVRFQPGLKPVIEKHEQHDQQSHGNWAGTKGELSDDDYRDIVYNAKTVEQAYTTIAKRLGKNMKAKEAELSEDEINVYRGVTNVERDAKRLLDGKIRFQEFQTWGQGIYVDPTKERASDYGTVLSLKLDKNAKILKGETKWNEAVDVRWQNENARVPNTWSSDFVDMNRIKMNINDMGYPSYSVSDLKNLYWASKGYDGFSPHGGEMVLFNGGVLTLNKNKIQKHQQHDQQSHGNWATGNFNEETDYENALMAYSERYGYKLSDKTFTGTTEDEVDDVLSYSDFGYVVINKFLRGTSESDLSLFPELKKTIKNRVKNLDKLIDEAPAQFGNTTLYRVFSDKVMNTLQSGDILTDKGFLSTTRLDVTQRDNLEARKWLGNLSMSDDTVGIILPNSRKNGKGFAVDMFRTVVDKTSSNSDREKEVLLPRNTPLKFIGYKTDVGSEAQVAIFQRLDNE